MRTRNARVMPVRIRECAAEIAALIRRASADVAAELGLTAENCPSYVGFIMEDRLLQQLDREDAHCFGIEEGGAFVGFVAVAPYRDDYEITRLAVAPECRHRGYGRLLMDAACEQARAMGLKEIGLGMIDENKRLKRWYEAQGFVAGEPSRHAGMAFTACGMSKSL